MFWQRRKDGRVYIYDRVDGKTVTVPRAKTKHLDGQPDDVVRVYVDSLRPRMTQERPVTNERLDELVGEYREYLETRALDTNTIYNKTEPLRTKVFPFFLAQDPPLTAPDQWALLAPKLLEHLKAKGLSTPSITRVNGAFAGFWKWLQEEGMVPDSFNLRLRRPRQLSKATPLSFTLSPDDVLSYVDKAPPDLAFMALCGFFFSLRPQETFALSKAMFRAGANATSLECGKVMFRANLYSKFAVNIASQKSKTTGKVKDPKAHSKGWVACFDERAARLLVAHLKSIEDLEAPIVPFSVDYNMRRWAAGGIPGITLKDLRRASLYWLGHHSNLDIVALRNHARHSKITTTDLYLRRPREELQAQDALDLDA